jgi:two-component system, OmpR family, phosphate regulon sensor histidine kinase PhoR
MGLFRRRTERGEPGLELRLAAERGRVLIEQSREVVIVLDADGRVVDASRRALESIEGLALGEPVRDGSLGAQARTEPVEVPIQVDGHRETLLFLSEPGELAAYEELRAGFTAAVSHELRTPLARLLALLESAELPDVDPERLVEDARHEIEQINELIDDVLFLSELETGRAVVSLGSTTAVPHLRDVVAGLEEQAERAGISLRVEGDEEIEVPLRPRMLRVVAKNLAENAIGYAGEGATFTLSVVRAGDAVILTAADDGVGVSGEDAPRLFERFYRADRARASRGTGLGLAIVKHVVTSAGGTVEASGSPGRGLTIRCVFLGA